jgi:hypothetical protein
MDARLATGKGTRAAAPAHSSGVRWFQLIIGVVCMAMIANLEYGWTLFVNPVASKYHFENHALQYAFTIFVLFETWLVPFKVTKRTVWAARNRPRQQKKTVTEENEDGSGRSSSRCGSLASAGRWYRLHVHDREPAIWMDFVR